MAADSPLTSIDTLHDGVTVVVGSTRGKIFQYDLRMSSVPVKTLDAHKSSVQCLRFQNEVQVSTSSMTEIYGTMSHLSYYCAFVFNPYKPGVLFVGHLQTVQNQTRRRKT